MPARCVRADATPHWLDHHPAANHRQRFPRAMLAKCAEIEEKRGREARTVHVYGAAKSGKSFLMLRWARERMNADSRFVAIHLDFRKHLPGGVMQLSKFVEWFLTQAHWCIASARAGAAFKDAIRAAEPATLSLDRDEQHRARELAAALAAPFGPAFWQREPRDSAFLLDHVAETASINLGTLERPLSLHLVLREFKELLCHTASWLIAGGSSPLDAHFVLPPARFGGAVVSMEGTVSLQDWATDDSKILLRQHRCAVQLCGPVRLPGPSGAAAVRQVLPVLRRRVSAAGRGREQPQVRGGARHRVGARRAAAVRPEEARAAAGRGAAAPLHRAALAPAARHGVAVRVPVRSG
jgi:hypothetical protein